MTKINYILTFVSGYDIRDELLFVGTVCYDKKTNIYGFMCAGKRLLRGIDETWEMYWKRNGWSMDYFNKFWIKALYILDELEQAHNDKHFCFEESGIDVNKMALEIWEEVSSNSNEQLFTNTQNMYFLKYVMIRDRYTAQHISSIVFEETLPEWLTMCQIKDVVTLEETLSQVGVDTKYYQKLAMKDPIIKPQSKLQMEKMLLDDFNYLLYITDIKKLEIDKDVFNAKMVMGILCIGIVIGYCLNLVHFFISGFVTIEQPDGCSSL